MKTHTKPNKLPQVEKVRQYYLTAGTKHPVELTALEEEYRLRLCQMWALLTRYHTDEQAVKIHMKNTGMVHSTAYADLRNAISIFGDVRQSEREGRRNQMYEWAARAYQLAADQGDVKSMNRAVENMMTLLGLNRSDADAPDFSQLEASLVVAALPEGMEDAILRMLKGGAVNLNKMPEIETIEYEEAVAESRAGSTEGN